MGDSSKVSGAVVRRVVLRFCQRHPHITVRDISLALCDGKQRRGSGHHSFDDIMRGDPLDMQITTARHLRDVMRELAAGKDGG